MTDREIVVIIGASLVVIGILWIVMPLVYRQAWRKGWAARGKDMEKGRYEVAYDASPIDWRWPQTSDGYPLEKQEQKDVDEAVDRIEAEGFERIGKFEWQRTPAVPRFGRATAHELPKTWAEYVRGGGR